MTRRILVAGLLVAIPFTAFANLFVFAERHCVISIPEEKGWSRNREIEKQSPDILIAEQSADSSRLAVLVAQTLPAGIEIHTPGVVDSLRSQVLEQGTITRQGFTRLDSMDAYEFVVKEKSGEVSRVINVMANGTLYSLTVAKYGDVDADAELTAIADSFHLTGGATPSKK